MPVSSLPRDERISNIVFMGMGEPFAQLTNATWRAICTLNDERAWRWERGT